MNPEIETETLPAGTHTIKVPKGWKKLVSSLPQETEIVAAETVAAVAVSGDGVLYTVKEGDSLSKIAAQFNVNIDNIKKVRGKTPSLSSIHPGEQLLIAQ